MRRAVSILVFASLLLLAFATPVAADATPIDERRVREALPLVEFTIPAEEGCGFPVESVDFEGRTTYVFITEDRHGNILERVIYHTTTRYTNLDTGASIVLPYDSVENYLTRPDGSFRAIVRNDAFLLGGEPPSALPQGVYQVEQGRVVAEIDAEGNLISEVIQEGTVFDVCAALS